MPSTDALVNRLRNARWAAANRNCSYLRPWLAGAPPYSVHLPGASMTIALDPIPKWPVELRNTRAMHGMLTDILGEPHERWPQWALRPWGSGWAVHWMRKRGIEMASSTVQATLFGRPTRVTFGPAVFVRSPVELRRKRERIRVDTVTPICRTSDGETRPQVRPCKDGIVNMLRDLAARISPSDRWYEWVKPRIAVDNIDVATEPAHVPIGDKYGVVHGWQGNVTMEANAVARWLLIAGSRIGMGSRIAFGFGWSRVSTVP